MSYHLFGHVLTLHSDLVALPSQTHPSYPFGNPTHLKHPASRPRPFYDPGSRTLFEDMGFAPATVDVTLRWKELALNELLPTDENKDVAERAVEARKMASGASSSNGPPPQHQPPMMVAPGEEDDDDEDDEDDEDDDEDEEDELEEGDEDEDDQSET